MENFESYRRLLFSIAYRMLGSASEAEDVVQDAFLRYSSTQGEEIRSLKSYLSTIVTRLCIDRLKSARAEREQYVGVWLPEPVLTTEDWSPLETTEQLESISMAFLVMLERLNPDERAVLLLHDVFEYDYQEISEIIGKSVANCRQILHRARERVSEDRPRFEPSEQVHQQLMESFLLACQQGDVQGLANILAQDAVLWSDGGGKVRAALRPVSSREHILRFLFGLLSKAPLGFHFTQEKVNGRPAILSWIDDKLINIVNFEIANGKIQGMRIVVNPDKMNYILNQLDDKNHKGTKIR